MKVCVMGLGYIGLPTAAMFAKNGVQTVGVDVNPQIVDGIRRGMPHTQEPGLGELVKSGVKSGLLRAQAKPESADAFIIAVPTPFCSDALHSCDLKYVLEAVKSILPYLAKGNTVIIESTIAPRSTEDCIKPLLEAAGFTVGADLFLAHCPERVLPGQILREMKYNNRIVGGITPACARHAAQVYATFVEGEILCTEAGTAEMCKCMENTFRDVNIALANELEIVCNTLKIDCLEVIRLANKHPRVNILQPGPGVGGHCLAVDPYFISAKAPENTPLIQQARKTNEHMPEYVAQKAALLVKNQEQPKIAILGLAYKGDVDDTRESPAVAVWQRLNAQGIRTAVYDPHVGTSSCASLEEALTDADLALVLTNHSEFSHLPLKRMAQIMRHPVIFDTRNVVKPDAESGVTLIDYGNLYQYA